MIKDITLLRQKGIRLSKRRVEMLKKLNNGVDRHFNVDTFRQELEADGIFASSATIYSALEAFATAGLIRRVATTQGRAVYDTNSKEHDHIVDVSTGEIYDVDVSNRELPKVKIPKGKKLVGVDVFYKISS